MGVIGRIVRLILPSDTFHITPEIPMLGLDLAEAFHCWAITETNTALRHAQHRNVFSARCPSCSHRQRCNFFVNRL